MCITDDANQEQLMQGFPITHIKESDSLNDLIRIGKDEAYFIKCELYSELKNKNDINSVYKMVEFTEGVELGDIYVNAFLIKKLLALGIRYLAFLGGGREFILNAIGCSDYTILDELIHHNEYKITDVPVIIHELTDLTTCYE